MCLATAALVTTRVRPIAALERPWAIKFGLFVGCSDPLGGWRVRRQVQPGHAEGHAECDEPLLGAVVQIALDATAGLVGGGYDARP
jgi:hypothetical protein